MSQYTKGIKKLLEGGMPPSWVIGEVSNLRSQASGHLYFSIKDAGSQLPAVMFRGQAARLRFVPRDGMQVSAFGELSVYEPHGRYQLVVRELEENGEGRLYKEFERLKAKLSAEGIFDKQRKRPLPKLPMRVAIVTSPSGAALQDFIQILKRRSWLGRLQIFPVSVQGVRAAEEIETAIRYINELGDSDLIVVSRGGGSLEDLWCFNEERVARAVSSSSIPVVSGVGHEIDFTLSDFAADIRAETPSGAAEMISSGLMETLDRLELARSDLSELAEERLLELKDELKSMGRELRAVSPRSSLERAFLKLDEVGTRFEAAFRASLFDRRAVLTALDRRFSQQNPSQLIASTRERLDRFGRQMEKCLAERTVALRGRLDVAKAKLQALSPSGTLKRGYAILEDENGSVLTQSRFVKKGSELRATLSDGVLQLKVEGRSSDPKSNG
ncbi:exodeoxyribonuclease VII large subunit [Pelagicoccus albus]|uniref:Exodeoxyribonuclease 7 large subunit n=1 Tax=Pelagicoccus albus TaxID=415222 RepID=A0A7X1E8R1_9BACT|nr:exodeoxyribonuclease VII large subunit [Pelagicoccus albus]